LLRYSGEGENIIAVIYCLEKDDGCDAPLRFDGILVARVSTLASHWTN